MADRELTYTFIEGLFEERAAILEYDAGRSRWEAEQLAAQQMGFTNKSALKVWVQEEKAKKQEETL